MSKTIKTFYKVLKAINFREKTLEERLSITFLSTGFFMSTLASITSVVNNFDWGLIVPSLIVAITCVLLPIFSSDLVKSTWIALFLVGIFYFPFIFMVAGGVRGPAPIYFVLLVAYMAFYFEGKKALFINAFLIFYYIGIIAIGYNYPELISSRDNEFLRSVDISVAVVSVSIVISIIASATFKGYKVEHRKTVSLMKELELQNERLTELSILDQLSGVYNRRHFNKVLQTEINHYKTYKQRFHIMMIDLDDFKQVNDTFGHLFGDEVLRKVAKQIQKATRDYDVIARYGGEEFCVIVSHLNPEDSIIIAERIRYHVESLSLRNDIKMTVSIGVAGYVEEDTAESVLSRADEYMYQAKARGKNCVVSEVYN